MNSEIQEIEPLFQNEKAAIDNAEKVIDSASISKDDLFDAYVDLFENFKHLYNQSVKMTRISDSTQRKLIRVQSQLEDQNQKIQENNEELIKLNATKDKFFSIISHDLKNPISSVLLMVELLKSNFDKLSQEQRVSTIGKINDTVVLVHELFDNLLRWSKTQTGNIQFDPEEISLIPVVEKAVKIAKSHADNKQIRLLVEVDDSTKVFADSNMIETVIRNLITNSIKFTNIGGYVKVMHEQQTKYDKIIIEDNGVGMTDAIKEKLFKINEKISSKGTAKETGTGLGLILCKEFIDCHKGKIWVESELGQGSKFIFRIPRNSMN